MIISKKWLSQYMDLSDITMEELADKISKTVSVDTESGYVETNIP